MFLASSFRTCRKACVLGLATMFAVGAFALPDKGSSHAKANRKDPAFVSGYNEGYRQGGNDSEALANYNDQGGPAYQQAIDGYTAQYGDKEVYQQRFRLGYTAGYKAGWDFNSGLYNRLGAGSW